MRTFDDFLEEQLKDPEFRAEYEALEPEYEKIREAISRGNTTPPCNEEQETAGEPKMSEWKEFLREELKRPELRAEWDALEAEFSSIIPDSPEIL
jgi:hypothetical protein